MLRGQSFVVSVRKSGPGRGGVVHVRSDRGDRLFGRPEARPSGSGFCAGLATLSCGANGFAVIPQCASVFGSASTGTVAPGRPCKLDGDCAPGRSGPSAWRAGHLLVDRVERRRQFLRRHHHQAVRSLHRNGVAGPKELRGRGQSDRVHLLRLDQGLMCSPSYVCVPIGLWPSLQQLCIQRRDQDATASSEAGPASRACRPAPPARTRSAPASMGRIAYPTTSVCRWVLDGAGRLARRARSLRIVSPVTAAPAGPARTRWRKSVPSRPRRPWRRPALQPCVRHQAAATATVA